MASKLARQMALRKRLEEEYKQANERLNDVAKMKTRKYHPMTFDLDSKPRYDPVQLRGSRMIEAVIDEDEDSDILDNVESNSDKDEQIKNQKELEEKRKEEEEEQRRRELQERLFLEEQHKRELEKRLQQEEENRRLREEKRRKKFEDKLKREEARRRREQMKAIESEEMEEIRKLMFDEGSRCDKSIEEIEKMNELKVAQCEEMKITEERIRQLEMSIATLDMELERFDLEKMRDKTKKVVKRMSLVINDNQDEEVDMVLQTATVKGFIQNKDLWSRYVDEGNSLIE